MGNIPTDQSPTLPQEFCQQIWPDGSFRYDAFGARQHVQVLHPENTQTRGGVRKGVVSFAQRVSDGKKNWREWTVPAGGDATYEAEKIIRGGGCEDIFISQQAFSRWRGVADLTAIGSNYVDLDYHTKARWQGRPPSDVAADVIFSLEEQGLPLPSYVLSTGRGLVCVWLTELLPFSVLPRWNLVQRTLADRLTDFGADKRALDAARVFRLVGSVNSRADWDRRHVGMVWCQGTPEAPTRHAFSTLADEVLPFTQAEIVSLRATRATRKAEGRDQNIKPVKRLTHATYWGTAFEDFQRIRWHRNPETGALPPGQRDAWIFLAANALSWMDMPGVMASQIRILAMQATDWSEGETSARLSAVVKRAERAASGLMLKYNGREVSPRYHFRASTMVEWLGIDPAEQRAAGLRVLVGDERRRELNTERTRLSRHRRGATARSSQQADRLALGRAALEMASTQDMSRSALATFFGVSTGQISKAMAEARELSE